MDGNDFFYNHETGVSSWVLPENAELYEYYEEDEDGNEDEKKEKKRTRDAVT